MWGAIILGTALMLAVGNASAQKSSPTGEQRVFSAPDGTFRFHYPKRFPLCTSAATEKCSEPPICNEDALACVIYPRDEFKGTNFAGAALRVRTITDGAYSAGSADECVTPKPVRNFNGTAEPYTDFLISAERPEEIIGGVPFIHGTTGGAAAGTASSTDVYRAFHGGRCYELAVTTLVSGFSYYPQGTIQRFTAADQRKVLSALNQILRSFRFTK